MLIAESAMEQIHMSSTFGTYKLEDRVATCAQKS